MKFFKQKRFSKQISNAQKKFDPDVVINALPKKEKMIAIRKAIDKLETMLLKYKHQLKDLEDELKRKD